MNHQAHSGHQSGLRRSASRNRLTITLALVVLYMLAEFIGGLLTNSLALLADAGHMLSDAAALGLSLFAFWMAHRPPTAQRTFGYYRAEILAALANGASLVAIAIYIFVEAFQRLYDPPEVIGGMMMAIAAGGLAINVTGLFILHGFREENLNIHGAWLHVLADTTGSVAAILAGLLIWWLGWQWVDPLASILIALLIVFSSWNLLKQSVAVLMESVPQHLDVDEIRDAMSSVAGVVGLHDLHVWTITSDLESLSAHVEVDSPTDSRRVLKEIRQMIRDRFGIEHMTIQIEPSDFEEIEPVV